MKIIEKNKSYLSSDGATVCMTRADYDALVSERDRYKLALEKIDHELGRPEGLGMPAPIVNASMIAREALAPVKDEDCGKLLCHNTSCTCEVKDEGKL